MSSSNRAVKPCDGILKRDEEPIGPMRLPVHRAEDFVDHFNRTYENVGLSIESVGPAQADVATDAQSGGNKKSPASQERDAGDDHGK